MTDELLDIVGIKRIGESQCVFSLNGYGDPLKEVVVAFGSFVSCADRRLISYIIISFIIIIIIIIIITHQIACIFSGDDTLDPLLVLGPRIGRQSPPLQNFRCSPERTARLPPIFPSLPFPFFWTDGDV